MGLKRSRRVAPIGLGLLLVVGLFVSGCAAGVDTPGDQLPFPVTWTSNRTVDGKTSLIKIFENGEAEVVNLAVGEIREVKVGVPCMEAPVEAYSGPATWEADRKGRIRIHTDKGSAIIGAGRARFEGVDWTEAGEPFCDGTLINFGMRY